MKTIFPDDMPDGFEEHLNQTEKINESIQPVIQSQEEIRKITEAASAIQRFHIDSPAMDALKRIEESAVIRNLERLSLSCVMPDYSFQNPWLESIGRNTVTAALGMYSAASLLGDYIQKTRK